MKKNYKKPWYNYWNPPYKSDLPNFFLAEQFDWAQEIISLQPQIKKELLALIESRNNQLIPYFSPMVNDDGNEWHTLAFKTWGIDVFENQNKCPVIKKIVKKYPQMVSASVNILMPNSELKEHQGDSDSFYRCHLGIEVPGELPEVGFEVEGEKKAWSEENLIIFLDAKHHRAFNKSSQRRVIFLFDYIRDEYLKEQKKICFNVRSFLLLQYIGGKWRAFFKFPKWMHRFVFYLIKFFLRLIYPYQKKKGVLLKHV